MNPSIQLKRRTPVFLIALTWFVLSPAAQALLPPPPPDGGYPGLNTAEGENALFNLTTGIQNTSTRCNALTRNTTGDFNTATGAQALLLSAIGGSNTATGANATPSQRRRLSEYGQWC